MAGRREKVEETRMYTPKAKTTSISARVKLTVKVFDNYVSVEGNEERTVPDVDKVNLDKEWQFLWDNVYNVCEIELHKALKELGVENESKNVSKKVKRN